MRRSLLFLPLPVLAALVAISACSKARTEDTTHLIPPAAPYVAAAPARAEAPHPPAPPGPGLGVHAVPEEDAAPSPEDLQEFQRPVLK